MVSVEPSTTNYLLWHSQIIPLVCNLGVFHGFQSDEKPAPIIDDGKGNKSDNTFYASWVVNDGLLLSWLLGSMKEDTLGLNLNAEMTYPLWTSLE